MSLWPAEVSGAVTLWGRSLGDDGIADPALQPAIPTTATTLDLYRFLEGPAFRLLPGATLELRNLTLLLPPLSAAPASSAFSPTNPSLIAHVFAVAAAASATSDAGSPAVSGAPAAGSGAAAAPVVLRDVVLVAASCSDLDTFTRQLCRPDWWRGTGGAVQVINGSMVIGNGSMPLGAWQPPGNLASTATTAYAATSTASMSRVVATCPETSRQPTAQPYTCSATVVYDGQSLQRAAAEMLAVTKDFVFLWLGANVRLGGGGEPWRTVSVQQGTFLGLYGTGGAAAGGILDAAGAVVGAGGFQLDFARTPGAFDVLGFLGLYDMSLLGLPYPATYEQPDSLLAAWLFAANAATPPFLGAPPLTLSRCALLLSEGEAGWWARAAGAGQAERAVQLVTTWRFSLTLIPPPAAARSATLAVHALLLSDSAFRPRMLARDCVLAPASHASLYGGTAAAAGAGAGGAAAQAGGSTAADAAAAAAGVWPLAEALGPEAALQADFRFYNLLGSAEVANSLVSRCDYSDAALASFLNISSTSGSNSGGGSRDGSSGSWPVMRVLIPSVPAAPTSAAGTAVVRRTAAAANGTLLLGLPPSRTLPLPRIAKPCELAAPPAAQAPRRVFLDMRGAPSALGFRPGARLALSHLTLYNLAPAWPYSPPPAPPARPPPSPRPPPPGPHTPVSEHHRSRQLRGFEPQCCCGGGRGGGCGGGRGGRRGPLRRTRRGAARAWRRHCCGTRRTARWSGPPPTAPRCACPACRTTAGRGGPSP